MSIDIIRAQSAQGGNQLTDGGSCRSAMPNASPQAARTAGAIWTTVTLPSDRRARKTPWRCRPVRAERRLGQWVMHWPHSEQSASLMKRLPETSMVVREPEPLTSQMESDCTLSHT